MATSVSFGALRSTSTLLSLLVRCGFWASYLLNTVGSRIMAWLLFDMPSCAVFPRGGSLCRISSRQRKLSSIAYKLHCRMILYMLFSNSLAPFISRLAHNNWKPCNVSSCKAGGDIKGLIWGIKVYPSTWEGWSIYGCSRIFVTLSAIPWERDIGSWFIVS